MEKEFVHYEIALKLKNLRFNEECFGVYVNGKFEPRYRSINSKFNPNQKLDKRNLEFCTAPLWGQSFDWFREMHNLDSYIKHSGILGYYFIIKDTEYRDNSENCGFMYEEARLECLKKLIEIIENK